MRRASTQLILSSIFIASAIAGCTLIAEVDRSKIDDNTGTGAAGGESPGTGGTPGEGGMGGETNAGGDGGAGGSN